jgi:antitoxin ParD1/3/4
MTSMNFTLPEALRQYVEEQVTTGGYGTASEYLRELIREDKKRKAQEKLEALLLQGLNSGPGEEVTPEFWQWLRAELLERHAQRTKSA